MRSLEPGADVRLRERGSCALQWIWHSYWLNRIAPSMRVKFCNRSSRRSEEGGTDTADLVAAKRVLATPELI